MWIAKKGTGRNVQQKESGWVRAESAKHGEQYVVGSCEYRRLQRCAPYGIYTKRRRGHRCWCWVLRAERSAWVRSATLPQRKNCWKGKF